MLLKWFVLCLWAIPVFTGTNRKCPVECMCSVDEQDRYTVICERGDLTAFKQLSPDVRVVIMKGSRQPLTMMPLKQWIKLEVLRITDSNVPAIGPNTFWGLKYLRILDLSKNNITNITENNFRGQDDLLELDLSKNKILSMASSVFRHLRGLQRLNLADNSIGELIQRNFFMLTKLRYLDLSGNPLQDLQPEVFRDLPELKIFKCRNCQLSKLNPQFYNLLPQLIELDFGRNEFKFLDKDEFYDVKRLKTLLLDGNQLSVVVDELLRMQKNLEHLDLSKNRLAKIPNDSLLHLGNLTYLDLSYNKLPVLEAPAVRGLSKLRALNISGNRHIDLHAIRETFELLPNLTHLSVADIGTLPIGLLVPFKQLRFLNISGNHLDNMSLQVLNPCRALEYLDISRNHLQGINEDTALRIKGIRNVRLDNNPLICDECHMGKLINVVRHLQWNWETYPMCFLPKTLRGSKITELDAAGLDTCLEYITDEEQNAASSTSHNFLQSGDLNMLAILGSIVFVLVAVIILILFVCFSKHRARYYTREDHHNGSETKCLDKNLDASTVSAADVAGNGNTGANDASSNGKNTNTATTPGALTTNTTVTTPTGEINFKFPIDDRVCTIDELTLPPVPTPAAARDCLLPPAAHCNRLYHGMPTNKGFSGAATAMAAVAAAATVIPPGAPTTPAFTDATPLLPADAVVVVLPTPTHLSRYADINETQPQQQQQQQQQMLQLTSLEPMVSVN